jgi:hypothetical protein
MHSKNRFFLTLVVLTMILLTACTKASVSKNPADEAERKSLTQKVQLIGSLAISGYGSDYVTLTHRRNSLAASTTTPVSIQAYIGINGKIVANGTIVENSIAGPLDLASGSCTFRDLKPDQRYRILVMAINDVGYQVKYINPVRADYGEIDLSAYPEMSDEEIGQLKWALLIADDALDDFSRIESLKINGIPFTMPMQLLLSSYRYVIAFTTYFLATEQFHKIPACQEIIQPRMDRMIQKMLQRRVWEYWATTSTGVYTSLFEPDLRITHYPTEHDPVRVRNIMYSGHLAHMIALYEKLYGDMKWSQPGSIVFEWSDNEKYVYDNNSLQKLMRDSFIILPAHCIECEPNCCYPECNQHPILALKLYDQVHGTHYFDDSKEYFLDWYLKNNMIDPVTHETAAFYLVKQRRTLGAKTWEWSLDNSLGSIVMHKVREYKLGFIDASADGWNGTFMHAWQPEYIERHYPYQREIQINSVTGALDHDKLSDQTAVAFFAMEAAEMGDTQTRDNLLAQCDDLYDPAWDDEEAYFYPAGKYEQILNLEPNFTPYAHSLTGQLIAIARANPKDGMLRMHNDPFPGTSGPIVKGVDFNKGLLRRAIYDHQKDVLVITIDAGSAARSGDIDMITVERLDPSRIWHLRVNGIEIQRYQGVGSIHVELPLAGRQDITLAAE